MSHFFPPLTDCFGPSQLLTREKPDLVLARCAELSADLRAPARCNWRYHAAHAGADGLSFVVERARDELPANLASPLIPRRWSKPLPHHSLGASFFGKPSPLLVDVIYSDTVPVAQRRTWRLGILSSHGGTNFNAIAEAIAQGHLNATIAVAICNNPGAKTFDIATAHGVPAELINGKNHPGYPDRDTAIQACLESHRVDVVIMAGYNKKLGNATVSRYAGRVLNIHPGLLDSQHPPGKYGGQGMYGDYVHEAILADRLAKTATTVHVADRWFDHGPQVMASTVPVRRGDSPDALGSRVYSAGRQIYWRAIRMHLHKLERDEAAPRPARFLA